jgi:hypothetical protein
MADRYAERGGRWDESERRSREGDYGDGERGFLERFSDEVRSWFGDEDAQRRRMRDEREPWRGEGGGDWGSRDRGRGEWRRVDRDRGEPARGAWGRRDWERGSGSDWMRGPEEREWSRDWGYVEGRGEGWGRGREESAGYGGAHGTRGGYGAWGREGEWDRGDRDSRAFGGYRPGASREPGGGSRDWMTGGAAGAYAGRGPRNYQRSDERIREDICERLTEHGDLDPTDVEVRVQNAEVTLEGSVHDRWSKRTAEDLAEGVWGVKAVHNLIRVAVPEPRPELRAEEPRQPGPPEQGRTGPGRGTWAA